MREETESYIYAFSEIFVKYEQLSAFVVDAEEVVLNHIGTLVIDFTDAIDNDRYDISRYVVAKVQRLYVGGRLHRIQLRCTLERDTLDSWFLTRVYAYLCASFARSKRAGGRKVRVQFTQGLRGHDNWSIIG